MPCPKLKIAPTERLRNKATNILVTNRCNMSCGNCSQLCTLFRKQPKELWDISLDQLEFDIKVLVDPCRGFNRIGIFGGEPTTHPQWNAILDLLASFTDVTFRVFTNGRNPDKLRKIRNVLPRIDRANARGDERIWRSPTLAPYDRFQVEDKAFYWKKAQKHCFMWDRCMNMVYDNRAYLCEPAAAFDRLLLGRDNWHLSAGWPLTLGEDPFLRTEEEIRQQAERFCYRCGICDFQRQSSFEPPKISKTNEDLLHKPNLLKLL